jgi:hypothetical protein
MCTVWCQNTTAHMNKTKIGQNPSYPKGQRRIGNDLAIFLTQNSSISFDESDYLCTICYLTTRQEFDQSIVNTHPMPMDIDEFRPMRAAAVAALSSISMLASTDHSVFSSSHPRSPSEASVNFAMDFESQIARKKSTALLNDIFALVGESPIGDMRNRNILRRKIDDVLVTIRQAAENILQDREDEEGLQIGHVTDITLTEANKLITSFKHLVASSEYSEQIRLLTLSPENWGRLKIQQFFSCSQHQARYSVHLRDTNQILSLPVDLRGNLPFDPAVEKKIFDFYHTDEISRV